MKILEVLTYYRPWISGLTIYVERLSKALVAQGHDVTVLTAQYDPSLPRYDVIDGVKIIRVPVAMRVSKGVIMPEFGPMAWKLSRDADVLHLHLPQFDAPGVALRGRLMHKPVVLTYHCDLQLPPGLFNRFVDRVVLAMNNLAGLLADAVVTYTRDYGTHSPFLAQYLDKKLHIIPPPVTLAPCSPADVTQFYRQHQLDGHQVIGFVSRLATEKGVEVLLNALPKIWQVFPDVRVLHAGPYKDILGEEEYRKRVLPVIDSYGDKYQLLGPVEGAALTAFYKSLDVLTIPSLNSTESFGLVQIEAMRNAVPVAACALPGVRQPVTMTGMGVVTPIGDSDALAEAIINILRDKKKYQRDADLIAQSFDPQETAVEYIKLFNDLRRGTYSSTTVEPPVYDQLRAMRDAYVNKEISA